MTNREYRRKGPYVVLSFLLLPFCVLCGVIVNSVLKADLALFRRPDLEKDKNKEQIWPGVVRLKLLFFGPKGEVKWVEKNRDGVSLPLSSWLRKLPFSFCHYLYYLDSLVGLSNAVAIWPVTGQGFRNTKWPAVLYSQ